MRLLLLLAALLTTSCELLSESSLLTGTVEHEILKYKMQIQILVELLSRECPSFALGKRDDLDQLNVHLKVLQINYQRLVDLFIKCKKEKADRSTPSTTSNPPTTPFANCSTKDGYSELHMQLLSYHNPTNQKAVGVPCDKDGSACEVALEICVSPLGSLNCEFYHHVTDVVGAKSTINLSGNLGNISNPLKIDLGIQKWQGVHVLVTVLDKDDENSLRDYHEVDEFSYELTDVQGSHRLVTLYGQRATDKTELRVIFTVPCPSPSTTLPTTPSTTLPTTPSTTLPTTPSTTLPTTPSTTLPTTPSTTTTTIPVPAECLTATNLTQSWRLDHNGQNIKGGGLHANDAGAACDLYSELGWFRFTGAAGRRMLDKCPKEYSCGTNAPFWTDGTHPQAVGKAVTIPVYGIWGGQQCNYYNHTIAVMRCSMGADDFIYKYTYTDEPGCGAAFCGMN